MTTKTFEQLYAEYNEQNTVKNGDLIRAKVLKIERDFATLDIGLKSEGLVSLSEFLNKKGEVEIEEGGDVEVVLEDIENGFGQSVLSREKAKKIACWNDLTNKYKSGESVTGLVTGKVKGGLTVDVDYVKAFLPGSLVDTRPVKDHKFLEGQEIEFKIIKMDLKRNNIVVSRKALLENENTEERNALIESLAEGQVIKGIVKNLTDYGAFVDLGGIDGLLHITDIAWKRIKHPQEALNIGDEINVKILKFDREKQRVSLGMKQLGDDPWLELVRKFPVGSKIAGKVTNITDYGCFIEIASGVEGLVHMSEMDWANKNIPPSKLVSLGDEIDVMVLEIENDRRRISLGIKQCKENPWQSYQSKHSVGEKIKGNIRSITDFGLFVSLDDTNIDGLVHLTDIDWNREDNDLLKQYSKGQEVETIILSIDPERERISLGIKQLSQDIFSTYMTSNPRGTIVSGKIVEIDKKDLLVNLADDINGFIKSSDLGDLGKLEGKDSLEVGDSVEAKVVGFDRKEKLINLSVRAKEAHEEAEAIKQFKASDKPSGASLGDILKQQINKSDD